MLTINGVGRDATIIDGNRGVVNDHIFNIKTGASLSLNGLTVTNSDQTGLINLGGTLILDDVVVSDNDGDGIHNERFGGTASATVRNSTIRNNRSMGIFIRSTSGFSGATIINSTVRDNSSYGIYITNSNSTSQAVSINSTVSGNGNSGFKASPGNTGSSRAFISHTTIVNNRRGLETGSASDSGTSTYTLKNSILANNSSGNCSGGVSTKQVITSLGHNISSDAGCPMFIEAGDLRETDPLLGDLGDNGGVTESFALLPGSPAIDAVTVPECTDTGDNRVFDDQRGFPRPFDTEIDGAIVLCDIGSFEFHGGSQVNGPKVVGLGVGAVTVTDGGTVDAGEGDVLVGTVAVPTNAVSDDLEIRVESYESTEPLLPPLPGDAEGFGTLDRIFRLKPEGTQFALPITFTILYLQEQIDGNELIEASLRPLLLVDGNWTPVDDCAGQGPPSPDPCVAGHDINANTLTVEATHFSTYAFDAVLLSDTLFVTSPLDTVDAVPGDGLCGDADGICTLRAAIMEANANANVFNIDLPDGTFTLTIDGSGEDASLTGDLDITSEMTIDGAGRERTTIDGNRGVVDDTIINVRTGASLTLTDLTVTNGDKDGLLNSGGTLVLDDVVVSSNDQDGIENQRTGATASLTVRNSTIRHNSIGIRVASGSGFSGATIIGSTIRNNSTYGIYISNSNSQANVINSTISSNGSYATRTASANTGASRVFLSQTTVANNSRGLHTGSSGTSSHTLKNTILDSNGDDNCRGGLSTAHPITSLGHNISSDAGCEMFTEPGDLQETDPLLGPLADNGGPTLTHALLIGSPAIDAVSFPDCSDTGDNLLETDQRGHDRQTGSGCDIGAYEFNADFKLPNVPSSTQWALIVLALMFGALLAVGAPQKRRASG